MTLYSIQSRDATNLFSEWHNVVLTWPAKRERDTKLRSLRNQFRYREYRPITIEVEP